MFSQLLKVQWKWTRSAMLLATVLGFAVPLMSVRSMVLYRDMSTRVTAGYIVRMMQEVGPLYALVAGASGLAVAFLAWNADHKGRHVYALSLPVSRARYSMMRFGAGSMFLLLPTLGVLLGCLAAIAIANLPPGMHAYPIALTMRFLLSSFVAYAIFFAIAASSQKASATLLGVIAGFLILTVAVEAMGVRTDLIGKVGSFLFAEPGLLSVFTGRWMLVDV